MWSSTMKLHLVTTLIALTACDAADNMNFKPIRISKSATINIQGQTRDVFPLFGAIREKDWADGWDPEVVYSESGDIEQGMIFRTRSREGSGVFTWVASQYHPEEQLVEYTVSAQGRIWFILVECKEENSLTRATITYTYTALTREGHEKNVKALNAMYARELKDWEEAINHYLSTGF